jgi:antirestriction protein ArdC
MKNLYQTITDKIVAKLESPATSDGRPSWTMSGALPKNATSGTAYRGVNVPILWSSGYASPYWATYLQWQSLGGQVRKGEKASTIVYFSPVTRKGSKQTESSDTAEDSTYLMLKQFSVFNSAQIDGEVELPASEHGNRDERIASAESFFASIGATLNHGGDRAYYSPSADRIQMPNYEQFRDAESYYSVLAHEHIHWTGSKDRLERTFGKRFADDQYAMEELVAELGAAFVLGATGITAEPREDHAHYLRSWLAVLKKDAKAIFTAASAAQKAATYLAEKSGTAAAVEQIAA